MQIEPTKRFSERVEDYIKYRPGYPAGLFALLVKELPLTPAHVIADIGSGTGILSEVFLKNGNLVHGIEPNDGMRAAGERLLSRYANFHSIDGTAEATGLPDQSVDLVTAGQAFHWFDADAARREFARILRPGGSAVLVWNTRRLEGTPFLASYEQLVVRYGIDYQQVTARNVDDAALARFFAPGGYRRHVLANAQELDFDALKGRLLSSSYIPLPGHPRYDAMLTELARLFDAHQSAGRVRMEYDTEVNFGTLE
jgi:SAM-dependent methyltransferase